MTRNIIALAASAALGIGTVCNVSRAADETNRPATPGTIVNPTAPATPGQPGTSVPNSNTPNAAGDIGTTAKNPGPIGAEYALRGEGSDLQMQAELQTANDPDKLFLFCAAINNRAETELARLAQQKSQDSHVKEISQRMIRDHELDRRRLQVAATTSGVQIPKGLPAIQQQMMNVFESLSGREFDQQFISQLRACHAMSVTTYQNEAEQGKNDAIKRYASKVLPMIQAHAESLQKAATAMGVSNETEAQPAGARIPADDLGTPGSRQPENMPK